MRYWLKIWCVPIYIFYLLKKEFTKFHTKFPRPHTIFSLIWKIRNYSNSLQIATIFLFKNRMRCRFEIWFVIIYTFYLLEKKNSQNSVLNLRVLKQYFSQFTKIEITPILRKNIFISKQNEISIWNLVCTSLHLLRI